MKEMQDLMKDPAALQQMLADPKVKAYMSQVEELMKDPKAKQQMESLANSFKQQL
jgi:quinol monooxygenase YgiN